MFILGKIISGVEKYINKDKLKVLGVILALLLIAGIIAAIVVPITINENAYIASYCECSQEGLMDVKISWNYNATLSLAIQLPNNRRIPFGKYS